MLLSDPKNHWHLTQIRQIVAHLSSSPGDAEHSIFSSGIKRRAQYSNRWPETPPQQRKMIVWLHHYFPFSQMCHCRTKSRKSLAILKSWQEFWIQFKVLEHVLVITHQVSGHWDIHVCLPSSYSCMSFPLLILHILCRFTKRHWLRKVGFLLFLCSRAWRACELKRINWMQKNTGRQAAAVHKITAAWKKIYFPARQ